MTTIEDPKRVIDVLIAIEVAKPEGSLFPQITDEQTVQIAHAFNGDDQLFWSLDNQPNRFSYIADPDLWHWKLRQARNNAMADSNLFTIIAADKKKDS